MKTKINAAIAIAAALALPNLAHAYDGTMTITGALTASTCTIAAASKNLTITMPTLSTSSLATAGSTSGNTPFNIAMSACTAGLTGAKIYVEAGANVDTATGNLKNTATTGAATGVQLRLMNMDGTHIDASKTDATTQGASVAALTANAGTASYMVGYYSAAGAPTAGAVTSSANFSMVYN